MNHDYNEDETIQDNFDLAPYLDTEIAVKKETHEESSLNYFQCGECGKQCKNEHEFLIHKNYHYKRKSGGDKVFCEKCNKNISKKWFTRHIQTLHPGQEHLVKFDFWSLASTVFVISIMKILCFSSLPVILPSVRMSLIFQSFFKCIF